MRTSPLHRDTFLFRTSLPGSRLRAMLRPVRVRDEAGRVLATVVPGHVRGRWVARALGATLFTALTVALMDRVGGSALAMALLGASVPVLLLSALALVELLSPERPYALLSDEGDTLLMVEPTVRFGPWRRSEVLDGEGRWLGTLRRAPLRDRFWPLGYARPLLLLHPPDGAAVPAVRVARWSPGWRFEREGRPVGRYAVGTRPGQRDRLELGDASVDPRLFVAAMLVARP